MGGSGAGTLMTSPQTIGPVERALWLRGVTPFTGLRARHLAALGQLMREEIVPAGQAVRPLGAPWHTVRLLAEGRLRASGEDGAALVVDAPQVIGLIEQLAGRELRARLVADSDVTILTIDRAAMLHLLEEEFAVVLQVRQALGRSLAAWQQQRGDWGPAVVPSAPAAPTADLDRFVERMLVLHRAPMLRAFGVAVLAGLLRDEPAQRLAAGDTLFAAGAAAERMFVVAEGRIEGMAPGGGSVRAEAGSVLGENEALIGMPYAYTAVCATPAAVLALDPRAIWDAAEDHFHVARALLAASARQLLRLEQRVVAGFDPPPDASQRSGQEAS
ncbi:MAG TPA: cyclic nucleotide-binding domain-containing protein [Candidatus Dormibacteraeota bacterium]|nr:cyclic nucleotide-binding domain-containing protein [Candidatus Dormibacteraeota bacterium]